MCNSRYEKLHQDQYIRSTLLRSNQITYDDDDVSYEGKGKGRENIKE